MIEYFIILSSADGGIHADIMQYVCIFGIFTEPAVYCSVLFDKF